VADDDDREGIGRVAPRHVAARGSRNAHRGEVARRHGSKVGELHLGRSWRRIALDVHAARSAGEAERQKADAGRGLDARRRAEALRHLPVEGRPPLERVVSREGQRDPERETALGLKPERDVLEPPETAEQQARACQHDHPERDLRHHQEVPRARARAVRGHARIGSQRFAQVAAVRLPRGRDAADDAGETGDAEVEGADSQVDRQASGLRQACRRQPAQAADAP
jgi:hypothetical protein